MTVTLVTQPATMHAFKTDLDEVHSLSRYCFSYSSPGGFHLLFYTMLRSNHVHRQSCFTLSKDTSPGINQQSIAPRTFSGTIMPDFKDHYSMDIVDKAAGFLTYLDLSVRT